MCLPVSVHMILLFIAHLFALGLAPSSIVSTVSAVSVQKVNGFPDPSNAFLVTKLLAGARNVGAVPDVRLPVTLHILSRLVVAMPTVFSSHYKCLMLRAMMVLAFNAYLRVLLLPLNGQHHYVDDSVVRRLSRAGLGRWCLGLAVWYVGV